jgi:DNA polymerase-3 subunit alpha
MQRYIKELKPSNLGDIAAMIALYRPGPMENIDTFIKAKYGKIPITYPHPSLKELLNETYGIIVYQDQVLLILQQFAGYSLGEADIVRKAMGKKIPALMAQERDRFVAGATAKGFEETQAVDIFNLIEPFAGYAFNKAHSVSYALISYWTAYFKAHYPVEYMASVLNSRMDHPEKVVSSINECFRLGIPVLLPDINKSEELFTIDKEGGPAPALRFGLAAIKTVGEGAVRPLVEERKQNGPYRSVDDLCRRAGPRAFNRRTLESLVRAGALDCLGPRGAVLGALDQIVATAQLEARTRSSGQTSMFDGSFSGGKDQSGQGPLPGIVLSDADVPSEQKAAWERELLGVPLSHNPLWALAALDAGDAITSLDQLDEDMQGQTLTLLGHISGVSERHTRDQKRFLVATLDLLAGPIEVIVWPDVLERTQKLWQEGNLVRASGRLRVRGDQLSLACDRAEEYSPDRPSPVAAAGRESKIGRNGPGSNGARQSRASRPAATANGAANGHRSRTVSLGITESGNAAVDTNLLRELIGVLLEFPGKDKVSLEIRTGARKVVMDFPVVNIGYCDGLRDRLETLLGPHSVVLQGLPGPAVEDPAP